MRRVELNVYGKSFDAEIWMRIGGQTLQINYK